MFIRNSLILTLLILNNHIEIKEEYAAFSFSATDVDLSIHCLNQPVRNSKSQTRTAVFAYCTTLSLSERRK